MKTALLFMLILLVTWGCNGQVQVPSADVKPLMDSLNALKARVAVLESQAVQTKSGLVTFAANEWRKAVYIPGITSAWTFDVDNRTTVNNPVFDFLDKQVKTDSLIILRQQTGTVRAVDYKGIFP